MTLTVGGTIHGRYTVVEVLGEGAMSTVYRVWDPYGVGLALKAFDPRGGTPAEVAEARLMFEREVEMLRRIHHPCIPALHDAFNEKGGQFFVMDAVDGRTLEAIVDQNGPAPEAYVLPIAIQLVKLLVWLHQHPSGPIVFRDIKPSNVMVDYEGRVHLIDFGVARTWKVGQVTDTFPMGTPGFAAPEQYGAAQSGPSTDIYALGATLYRTLTAVDPDPAALARPPLRTLAPGCSEEMEQILERCLQADVARRYHRAAEVLDALIDLHRTRYPEVEVPPLPSVEAAGVPARGVLSQVGVGLMWTAIGLVTLIMAAQILLPTGYHGGRVQGVATACKSNLKNIGTALEMYSTDNGAHFPRSVAELAPNYLKAIPTCPAVREVTYSQGYAMSSNPDNYTVLCSGNNHPNVGYNANYPQYTSTQGLLER